MNEKEHYFIWMGKNERLIWNTPYHGNFSKPLLLFQWFPTFFCLRHLCLVLLIFGGTPNWFDRYKNREIVTIGGTLIISSRHFDVLRLGTTALFITIYSIINSYCHILLFVISNVGKNRGKYVKENQEIPRNF